MTGHNLFNLSVRTEHTIPTDVLVEHIAVGLRELNFTGKVDITVTSASTIKTRRPTPFDGPEVFDDEKAEEYTGPRPNAKVVPLATGGFVGNGSFDGYPAAGTALEPDLIGLMSDPFPLTTRVIDKLREHRQDG